MLQQTPSTTNTTAATASNPASTASSIDLSADNIVVFATSSIRISRPKAIKRKSSKRRTSSSSTTVSSSSSITTPTNSSHTPPTFNFLVTSPYYPPPKPVKITAIPSILIDFTAMTLCDLMKTRKSNRSLPEFVYFVQKVTHQAKINVRTLLVALIYLQRAKSKLPKRAIGSDAAVLIASKYLDDSTWTTHTLTNYQIYTICNGLFSFDEIQHIERGFLKLLQYECFIDDGQLNSFVEEHRVELGLF
ncbi:hypothetical protein BDF20DRAFT_915572 [Mycotypha africana]|uniref:uncharacterized protein n=1 Tax=Mycotypha africana TaxID=64632 RepID=UPI00230132CC|nr:uncharacterized protein BDF20DRAFT_915572 [Mycotypha africana]KAI8971808.1 hypothetical protein BDF20DRAFT_915572 [Mycotypha africana]